MTLTFRAALLLGCTVLPFAAHAQDAAPPAPAAAAQPAAVPPLAFQERTLANGLRVYTLRDTSTANVAIQVWYDVGSRDDPAGRSGFAHMFEHLMFKGTRNLVSEQFDRLTEDVGGYNNASTNDDYTNYYEVVPANHLERLLFAEADRMSSLVVEPVTFGSERHVVEEELRQRTMAQPYGRLFSTYYPAISYARHPYARGTIGSIANLDSASIDDVRAFHDTYYRPDNAVLVVAGNFDQHQLDTWIDHYFTPIRHAAAAIPRVTVAEPARTQATHNTVYEQNTPLPAVLISYRIPADDDPDVAALTVLDGIVSTGEHSRLYETLVYRDRIAQSASSMVDSKAGPGNFVVYAIASGDHTPDQAEAGLRREVARLRDTPVSDAELTEARNELVTAALRQRETAEGRAELIAQGAIIDRDPHAADRRLAAIQAVTAADIQRVARRYLTDDRSAAIRYLPHTDTSPAGDTVAPASTVQAQPVRSAVGVAVVTPATEAERVAPPSAAAAIAPVLPTPHQERLANGLTVITVERHDLPLVTASLVARGGGALDPADRAGLGSVTAELLTKGTTTRSATDVAASVEALGSSLESGADWDGSSVSLTVRTGALGPAMDILSDVVLHPAFAAAELDRSRAQALDGLRVQMSDPASLAGMVAGRAVYGATAYGHPLTGTLASLPAITRTDLSAAYRATWQPAQTALVLVGDITPAAARQLAERSFGAWRATPGTAPAVRASAPAYPQPRVIVVDMPGAGQAGVVVARPAIARRDPSFYPASVANGVLGGGFSSRLNQEIRIRRGYAYGAGSALQARLQPGPIAARTQTRNEVAAQAVAITVAEMRRMGTEPVAASELGPREATLIGDFGRSVESNDGIAGRVASYFVQDVPLTELQRYIPQVSAVDPAAVQAAGRSVLDPARASIVVVGDSRQFLPALRQAYANLEVIPVAELDLDSPTLRGPAGASR